VKIGRMSRGIGARHAEVELGEDARSRKEEEGMSRKPSPALVVALTALFFALGGSAFALGQRALARGCGAGNVRGTVHLHAAQSFPDRYTSRGTTGRYSCSGRGVQAKRVDVGVYDVRFPGNPGSVAVATPVASVPLTLTWTRQGDGAFRVFVRNLGGGSVEADFALTLA
jgi:hypothetical protein